jgi:hypothetical protein
MVTQIRRKGKQLFCRLPMRDRKRRAVLFMEANMREKVDGRGWKFLNPYGATIYNGVETLYPLPRPDEKWGPWFVHPQPVEPDGKDCGPGRWHVMNLMSADFATDDWWVWFAEYRGIIGQSTNKTGVREIRLRRVTRKAFIRVIRWGWCRRANLEGANLIRANLEGANLYGANLYGANLEGAIGLK